MNGKQSTYGERQSCTKRAAALIPLLKLRAVSEVEMHRYDAYLGGVSPTIEGGQLVESDATTLNGTLIRMGRWSGASIGFFGPGSGAASIYSVVFNLTEPVLGPLRREYRSTYRDTMVTSETLVEGKWFTAPAADTGASEVSFEREVGADQHRATRAERTVDVDPAPLCLRRRVLDGDAEQLAGGVLAAGLLPGVVGLGVGKQRRVGLGAVVRFGAGSANGLAAEAASPAACVCRSDTSWVAPAKAV